MSSATRYELPGTGLWGFSHCASADSWFPWAGLTVEGRLQRLVAELRSVGADSFRPHIHWHRVEPVLATGLRHAGDVTEELVEEYAAGRAGIEWELTDTMVDALVAAGIEPHLVIAAGYDFEVPVSSGPPPSARAVPDCIGKERYIAQAYLHTRGAVRRYRQKVHLWQLENELNVAAETMLLARWRSGRAWLDRGFLDALIEALALAVREEDESALRSHNFHTDMRVLKGVYDWRDDVSRWLEHIDIVGVDSYPNYLVGTPPRGASVGRRVAEAVRIAGGRPVMVMESGYPVKPSVRGMSEARQAEFVRDAVASAVSEGAAGFYYYCLCSPEGFAVEGPWSNKHFQSVEPWWGFIRSDDSRRAAWHEYSKAVEDARERLVN